MDRLLGEHGIEDTAAGRREFERVMTQACLDPSDHERVQRGWKIGAEDFCDWLADKLGRPGRRGEQASQRSETDAVFAERMVLDALKAVGWREADLATKPKGHRVKVKVAQQLRTQTPMSRQWIAKRLSMGSAS